MSARELSDAECDAVLGDVFGVTTWRGLPVERTIARTAYAAGRAAGLESAAKVCKSMTKDIVCPEECAAAIRALTERTPHS